MCRDRRRHGRLAIHLILGEPSSESYQISGLMDINSFIHGLGSIGLLSSRGFLPAFITAVSLRYGSEFPFLRNIDLLKSIGDEPTWFTHGGTICFLGVMSLLEIAADKIPEAREALSEIDGYSKTILSVLLYLGVLSSLDIDFIRENIEQAGLFDTAAIFLIAGGTYSAAKMRNNLLEHLRSADEDDDLGLQSIISWSEDLWAALGIFALLLFPVLMIILNGIALTLLFSAQKYAQYREERSKAECEECHESVYRSAMACPKCGSKRGQPARIGALGQSKDEPEEDLEAHPYRLVTKKRCPVCATRFTEREVKQKCDACGHELMADQQFARDYLHRIRTRLPTVLGIGFLF